MIHGQEIITELLETIIDSNNLEMEIYEIEGDGIVFYDFNNTYTPSQLYDISIKVLKNFKSKIEILKQMRKCECGACQSISNLTLKFIIHKDQLNRITVKNFKKLYGRGLIIAHLLLKNKIENREYILFTEDYLMNYQNQLLQGLVEYNHLDLNMGNIKAKYIVLRNG
jgi:hypothetical protein